MVGNALRLRGFKSGFAPARRAGGPGQPEDDRQPGEGREAEEKTADKNVDSAAESSAERKESMTKVMTIEGMMCGHCTGRVQKALEAIEGVSAVAMSLEAKTATVELGAEVSDEALTGAVTQAGYEVKGIA